MIKKAYVSPEMKITVIECQSILAGSGYSGFQHGQKSEIGGTINSDETGALAAKSSFFTFWDED